MMYWNNFYGWQFRLFFVSLFILLFYIGVSPEQNNNPVKIIDHPRWIPSADKVDAMNKCRDKIKSKFASNIIVTSVINELIVDKIKRIKQGSEIILRGSENLYILMDVEVNDHPGNVHLYSVRCVFLPNGKLDKLNFL